MTLKLAIKECFHINLVKQVGSLDDGPAKSTRYRCQNPECGAFLVMKPYEVEVSIGAAQHLEREQEPDCPRCGSDSRNIEITCVHCGYLFVAAQPPQELVGLREKVELRRKHFHHMYSTFREAEMADETGQTKNGWQIYLAHVNELDEVLTLVREAALTRGEVGT